MLIIVKSEYFHEGFGSAEIAPPKNQPPGGVQKAASTL